MITILQAACLISLITSNDQLIIFKSEDFLRIQKEEDQYTRVYIKHINNTSFKIFVKESPEETRDSIIKQCGVKYLK